MQWGLFKSRIKKVWSWFKHHWYIPLLLMGIIIALLIWLLTRNGAYVAALIGVLESSREAHRKEVETLNEIDAQATRDRQRILDQYNKNIKKLEKAYAEKDKELDGTKKKEIKKLVEEGYNDPERLSREIARLYGLEHG